VKKTLVLALLPLLSSTSFVLAMEKGPASQEETSHALARLSEEAETASSALVVAASAPQNPAPESDGRVFGFFDPVSFPVIVEKILGFVESRQDRNALSRASRAHHQLVRAKSPSVRKDIAEKLNRFPASMQTLIRASYGRTIECDAHSHHAPLQFLDFLRSDDPTCGVLQGSYENLTVREFDRCIKVISDQAHFFLPEENVDSAETRAALLVMLFRLGAEESTARIEAATNHVLPLIPEGANASERHYTLVYATASTTAAEMEGRATELAAFSKRYKRL
jgi:hypothetical protein